MDENDANVAQEAAVYFPGHSPDVQVAFYKILHSLRNTVDIFTAYTFQVVLICIIINIIHLNVLCRKEMRSSSTNVIMIGLAFWELVMFIDKYRSYFMTSLGRYNITCYNPLTYAFIYYEIFIFMTTHFFLQNVMLLAILLAAVRTVSIKNAMNPRFDFVSGGKFGWYLLLVESLITLTLSALIWFCFDIKVKVREWPVDMRCPHLRTRMPEYGFNSLYPYYQEMIGAIANVIPSVSFPILTILLINELRKVSKTRKRVANSQEALKRDHTTKLITFIAASFMVAELPKGLISIVDMFPMSIGFGYFFEQISVSFSGISILNCATRGLVCYAMSSQYRTTAKNLYGCGGTKVLLETEIVAFSKVDRTMSVTKA